MISIFVLSALLAQDIFDGYTLFCPLTDGPITGGGENYSRLMDNNGNIINQWNHDRCAATAPYLMPDSTLICPFKIENPYIAGSAYGGKIIRYGWSGNILWEYDYSDTNYIQHHDIEPMPNGNILIISWDRKTYLEVLASGRQDVDGEMWPDKVVELHPIGLDSAIIVWEWKFWDHLIQDADPEFENYGVVSDHPELIDVNLGELPLAQLGVLDWNHINSIDYNEEFDQIILSSRNMSEFYIIDHSTTTLEASGHSGGNFGMGGDILYRWGNPMNYGRGTIEDKMLIGQHDVNWIDAEYPGAGNIIIFNNGAVTGFGQDGTLSSIVEITPPVNSEGAFEINSIDPFGPLIPVWTYISNSFSDIMSGARRLPNGNTFVTVARELRLLEVDYSGNLVWEYVHNELGQNAISKAFKYPLDYLIEDSTLAGDVNGDYNADIFDIILMVNFILDIYELDSNQLYLADLNGNGDVSVDDIMLLLGLILS